MVYSNFKNKATTWPYAQMASYKITTHDSIDVKYHEKGKAKPNTSLILYMNECMVMRVMKKYQ